MKLTRAALTLIAAAGMSGAAHADRVQPYWINGPRDSIYLAAGPWNELGNGFDAEVLIESRYWLTDETACFDGSDDPDVPNLMVEITNLSSIMPWFELCYVADPETSVSNFDGWIGNDGFDDAEAAFKIDAIGTNRPLVFESMPLNIMFEEGESWWFIIQDYESTLGGPPSDFSSTGMAGHSRGWPPSTGSIIARAMPTPATLPMVGLAAISLTRRR